MATDLQDELIQDSTAYCCYCGMEQTSFSCCGENHFETFAQMDKANQDEILSNYQEYK